MLFKTKDESDARFYTPENLRGISFVLDDDCSAPVKLDYDLKKRYAWFVPDTTANLTWKEFRDSTGIKRQDVKGTMILKDRWGGVSTFPLTMSWYNTTSFTLNIEATVEEINKGIPLDLSEIVKKLGLVYTDLEKSRRVSPYPLHHQYNDLAFEEYNNTPEKGMLILYDIPVPGKIYSTNEIRTLSIGASEVDKTTVPSTLAIKILITLTVKSDPIDNLAEKLKGKWMVDEVNEAPALTNDKIVLEFISATKAVSSSSRTSYTAQDDKWSPKLEHSVQLDGNKVTLTSQPEKGVTLVSKFSIVSVSATEMKGSYQQTIIRNGRETGSSVPQFQCWKKVTTDYSQDILGLWEGQSTGGQSPYDDGKKHRWEFKADGTFTYYQLNKNNEWVADVNSMSEYFVDASLLCTRWKNVNNEAEFREWWEIASIENGKMTWFAIRKKDDDSLYVASFSMTKVE